MDSLEPKFLSGIYHVDEMMVHTKREKMEIGHYQWLWNIRDDTTRYWVTTKISQRRGRGREDSIPRCKEEDESYKGDYP